MSARPVRSWFVDLMEMLKRLGKSFVALTVAAAVGLGGAYSLVLYRVSEPRPVIEGRIYRMRRPSTTELEDAVRRYGIRTAIYLGGPKPHRIWYQDLQAAAARLGLRYESIRVVAHEAPSVELLERLLGLVDEGDSPILVFCEHGVDRTGLFSALATLKLTGSIEHAKDQLDWRWGYIRWRGFENMVAVIEAYEQSYADRPIAIGTWVRLEYPRLYALHKS